MLLSCGSGQNHVKISKNSVRSICDVDQFGSVWRLVTMVSEVGVAHDVSRQVGTDTGSDTDISMHISLQIVVYTQETTCRFYQEKSYWIHCNVLS